MLRILLALIFCFISCNLDAKPLLRSAGFWSVLGINGRYHDWLWEIQPQTRMLENELSQIFFSLGAARRLNDHLTLWMGGLLIQQESPLLKQIYEYRLWQDLIWHMPTSWGDMVVSGRMDERRLEHFSDISYRYRQRLLLNYHLTKHNDWFVRNDLFINLNRVDWVRTNTINQNRIYSGIETSWHNRKYRTRFGYQNQYIFSNPIRRENHILILEFFYALN